MEKRIFVTGGLGFIGYHFIKRVKSANADARILVYDNYTSYGSHLQSHDQWIINQRAQELKPFITLVQEDIRDKDALSYAIKEFQPTHIMHLAGIPLADVAMQQRQLAMAINVEGTLNVLYAIDNHKVPKPRFVFLSSSFVYGNFQGDTATENHSLQPVDIYGSTKLAGEVLVQSYCSSIEAEYVLVRTTSVYGPYDTNRRIIQTCIERTLNGLPLQLHANSGLLDFTYVEDLAQGLVRVLYAPEAAHQVFNMTRGEGRTLEELVECLRVTLPDITVEYIQTDFHRPKRGTLAVHKARQLLGYEPRYRLEKGIPIYIEAVEHMLKAFQQATTPAIVREEGGEIS